MAVRAMLAQIWDGYEHPVSYYRKELSGAQRNWHPFKQERYACQDCEMATGDKPK
jgi:hypothetical protein